MTCGLQAELRKEQNLKYMGLPWVFVQPTRLKSVKIPHSKNNNKQKTFNDGEDGLFSFLGDTDISFSEDEIKLMKHSMKSNGKQGTINDSIPSQSSLDLFVNADLKEAKSGKESPKPKKNYQEPEIDHDEIYSAREMNLDFTDFDSTNSPNLSPSPSMPTNVTIEPASMKSMIQDALITQETVKEQFAGKVKLSNFAMNSIPPNDPNENTQSENEKGRNGLRETKKAVQGSPKPARKRLLQAIQSQASDLNDISYSQGLQENKDKVQKQFAESLGAQLFKQYIEKKNEKIPESLMNI